MAGRVVWSTRALADLEAIASFIAVDSEHYARSVIRRIVESTGKLQDFPRAGRIVPEFNDPDIRELIAYSYRVICRHKGDEVLVIAVIHGKRML